LAARVGPQRSHPGLRKGATHFAFSHAAYLPEEIVQRYGIHVIPLNVLFGNRIYKEGLDLSYEQFYQKLAQAKNLPTTSQPAVGEFYDLYSERIEALEKVRTKRKAVNRLLDVMVEEIGSDEPVRVAIGHAMAPEEGQALLERARSRLNCTASYLAQIGPVIGTHAGPGALGMAACTERVIQGE